MEMLDVHSDRDVISALREHHSLSGACPFPIGSKMILHATGLYQHDFDLHAQPVTQTEKQPSRGIICVVIPAASINLEFLCASVAYCPIAWNVTCSHSYLKDVEAGADPSRPKWVRRMSKMQVDLHGLIGAGSTVMTNLLCRTSVMLSQRASHACFSGMISCPLLPHCLYSTPVLGT